MSLETSQKILKVFGIIYIVIGILGILAGLLAFAGGGILAASGEMAETAGLAASAGLIGIIAVISGVIELIEGIFSVKASKDSSKIMPAWVFAIIGLVCSAISMITSFTKGAGTIVSSLVSLGIAALIFVAANTIKKSA